VPNDRVARVEGAYLGRVASFECRQKAIGQGADIFSMTHDRPPPLVNEVVLHN